MFIGRRPLLFFTALLVVLALVFVVSFPADAVVFGERADFEYWWEHRSTWPYGTEDFTAFAKFKGGDTRVVFAGANGNVAIYDLNSNTWLPIGRWPHGAYYKVLSIAVRDGNSSIVFGGQYGRYAVLEKNASGSWVWVKSGTWPPGAYYNSSSSSYSNDILAMADKPDPSDDTVVMGGANGDVALLDASNNFVGSFKWYYGQNQESGGRAKITSILPASGNKLLLLGYNGGSFLGCAAQYLNANNTLGSYTSWGIGSGIVRAVSPDGVTAWYVTSDYLLGYVKVNNLSDKANLIFTKSPDSSFQVGNTLGAWANGTVFIGGDNRFHVYRYDRQWGIYNGWAPVKIRWVETLSDGRIYIGGEGKIYLGTSYAAFYDAPLVKMDAPPVKYSGRIYKLGGWFVDWQPVRFVWARYPVPEGGIAKKLIFRSYVNYQLPSDYSYTGNFVLRVWGYQGTGESYEVNKVLLAQFPRSLAKNTSIDETLTVDVATGVTYVELSFDIDSRPASDDNGYFNVVFELKEVHYQVFEPQSVSIRKVEGGNLISWKNKNYPWPHSVNYQYALRRDGVWIMDWTSNTQTSFLDATAEPGRAYKYELLTRYKNSASAHSYPIDDQALLTAEAKTSADQAKASASLAAEQTVYEGKSAAYWAFLAAQDRIAPTVKVQGYNGATCTTGSTFTLVISATDNGPQENLRYRVICDSFDSGWTQNNVITITGLSGAGAKTATIKVTDNPSNPEAGNVAQTIFTFFKL